MYYTVQVKLKVDQAQKMELVAFESLYIKELQALIAHMERLKLHHPFSFYDYSTKIHKASHWAMYQIADKIAKAHKEKRQGNYARSGTWAPSSYQFKNDMIYLKFGVDFQPTIGKYHLAMDEHQSRQLSQGKQVRLDLTHDEVFWYCNVTILAQDA